ncbi:MAG TPA: glycine cleavage system protein GcvH [Candidatus Sulfotelmatobacter sp.]|nr:glycine cleavage system protein GcvH [Candidatus Sulfotelmatobacter sp.]
MSYPADLKYSKEHEWVKVNGKVAAIGITHYAQDSLGDVVYVELPAVGKEFKAMQEFGVVESVKSVSTLYCPVSGKVVERNTALENKPELVNSSPYGDGWIIKVELADPAELNNLLSADDYQKLLK